MDAEAQLNEKVIDVSGRIVEVRKHIRWSLFPTNYYSELAKFEKDHTYNPQFTYEVKTPKQDQEVLAAQDYIQKSGLPSDLRDYMLAVLEEVNLMQMLGVNIGKQAFSKYSRAIFADEQAPTAVWDDLRATKKPQTEKYLNAEELLEVFRSFLTEENIAQDFELLITAKKPDTIRISRKKIVIGERVRSSLSDTVRLVQHEIQGHVLRALNAQKQEIPHIRLHKMPTSILISEGLAVLNEAKTNTLTEKALIRYKLRNTLSLEKSFADVYAEALEQLNDESSAFDLAFRLKKGLSDTSEPGGFSKDRVYLNGFNLVNTMLKKTPDLLQFLYAGNIAERDLILLDYGLIRTESILIPHFHSKL